MVQALCKGPETRQPGRLPQVLFLTEEEQVSAGVSSTHPGVTRAVDNGCVLTYAILLPEIEMHVTWFFLFLPSPTFLK